MLPVLTPEEEIEFNSSTNCHICNKEFEPDEVKVRDHQHSHPFKFRGAAHQTCNLWHAEQDIFTCYFHNLSYDSHFFIKELAVDKKNISVLASSEEKYISFTKYIPYKEERRGHLKIRFVDTLRFLPSSLSNLASILPEHSFKETIKEFPDQEKFHLLTRKGVFPYFYIDGLDRLEETQLPRKETFYNKLTLEEISEEDYLHAQRVWETFSIQNLGEYSDL
jgi:hypothetical protein